MKIAAMTLMAAMSGVAAGKQPVYLLDNARVPLFVRAQAVVLANKMFATIGIGLDWHMGEPRSAHPIVVELATRTPTDLHPGALAYALPYEGVHIRVFYDRVENAVVPGLRTALLAHVLVHEITHILQRVFHHSGSGIMKAFWTDQDYFQMRTGVLPFAPEDIILIQRGLAK